MLQKKKYSMETILLLLLIGICSGFLSGLIGIGGGVVIVPALIFVMGYSQHQAQGTALAMFLIPIGILGVMNYYKAGQVEVKTALIVCSTFVIGSFLGSKLALTIDQQTLRRIFGVIVLLISLKLILGK